MPSPVKEAPYGPARPGVEAAGVAEAWAAFRAVVFRGLVVVVVSPAMTLATSPLTAIVLLSSAQVGPVAVAATDRCRRCPR